MSASTEPLVLRTRDARGVVALTLNRPQSFNSLSEAMLAALQQELDALAEDEAARAVVLAGAGKAFCAGHDLKEMRGEPSLGRPFGEPPADRLLALHRGIDAKQVGHQQSSIDRLCSTNYLYQIDHWCIPVEWPGG